VRGGGLSETYDLSRGIVSVREFSDFATKIVRAAETQGKTVLIGRRSKVFAALVPTTARKLMEAWEERNEVPFASAVDSRPTAEAFERLRGTVFHEDDGNPERIDFANGSVTVSELTRATTKVLRAVESGRPLLVTRHSNVVAMLVPRDATATYDRLLEGADPAMAVASIPDARAKAAGTTTTPSESRSWLDSPDL
jgi:prevent-host-death family protein